METLRKLASTTRSAGRYRLKLTLKYGSRLTKDAANAVRNCRISGTKIYVGGYIGRGRWTKSYSYQAYLVAILDR